MKSILFRHVQTNDSAATQKSNFFRRMIKNSVMLILVLIGLFLVFPRLYVPLAGTAEDEVRAAGSIDQGGRGGLVNAIPVTLVTAILLKKKKLRMQHTYSYTNT